MLCIVDYGNCSHVTKQIPTVFVDEQPVYGLVKKMVKKLMKEPVEEPVEESKLLVELLGQGQMN